MPTNETTLLAPAVSYHDLPIAYCAQAGDLFAALEDSTDAAIWSRPLSTDIERWLGDLPPERLPSGRFVMEPHLVRNCVFDMFRSQEIEQSPELDWLCEDIQTLADQVSAHSQAARLRLRVEPVFNNACTKLHIDNVFARLICTYRGPGTELGLEGTEDDACLSVSTGMPVLLKGKRWPGPQIPRLRHRSPTIEGTGLCRLMVVLEGCPDADILPSYDRIYDCETLIR